MKNLIFALILPLSSLAASPDPAGERIPLGRVLIDLHHLAAAEALYVDHARLVSVLPSFAESTSGLARSYVTHLDVDARARLRERLPRLVAGLVADEPYLGLALAKVRREIDPAAARRPLRLVVRDYWRIAAAKLRGSTFVIADKAFAMTAARALLRFEGFVNDHAETPQTLLTPAEEVIDILGNLPEMAERPEFMDVVARYLAKMLPEVDLNTLPREYRATFSLGATRQIAAHLPALVAAIDRVESAQVVKTRERMRGRNSALSFETELKLGLKAEGSKWFGSLVGRYSKSLEENLAKARDVEIRAHRLLRLEEIIRDGALATCADGLDHFVKLASQPALKHRRPRGSSN